MKEEILKKVTVVFEKDLHMKFKIKCIQENRSMQDTLILLVEQYLAKDKK